MRTKYVQSRDNDCSEDHSYAVDEGDAYMLMSLVNSPRSGVCGYEG